MLLTLALGLGWRVVSSAWVTWSWSGGAGPQSLILDRANSVKALWIRKLFCYVTSLEKEASDKLAFQRPKLTPFILVGGF